MGQTLRKVLGPLPGALSMLVVTGGSAVLTAYSMSSLAHDDLGVSSRHLRSVSLLSAGFIALLLVIERLSTIWTEPPQDSDTPQRESLMHKITKADIVVSVGRGLIMAAAIIGATYFIGSWYFGGADLDTIYQSVDESFTTRVEHATAPTAVEEATQ